MEGEGAKLSLQDQSYIDAYITTEIHDNKTKANRNQWDLELIYALSSREHFHIRSQISQVATLFVDCTIQDISLAKLNPTDI